MGRKLYNFAAFQAGWFACVFGAAWGHAWVGPLAVLAILGVHLALQREREREALFLAASIPLGLVVNIILRTTEAVVTPGGFAGELWLCALWPLFASVFNESMSWMRGRFVVGVLFGVLGAPLSYWAGERAGALTLHPERALWVALVALTWAGAMVALLALQRMLTPRTTA